MALIAIGPWKRDSTYRVHPLRLMDSTYRVPLLDSKLVRLRYAWYYRIKSPGPSSALAALGTPQPAFWTLNAVEPRLMYPNYYLEHSYPHLSNLIGHLRGPKSSRNPKRRDTTYKITARGGILHVVSSCYVPNQLGNATSDPMAFKIPQIPSSVLAALGLYSRSFGILNAVEPSVVLSNYYVVHSLLMAIQSTFHLEAEEPRKSMKSMGGLHWSSSSKNRPNRPSSFSLRAILPYAK